MLFLNAAIFEVEHKLTKNNLESMFQVNYLSQFYLARLLMSHVLEASYGRIIIVSCESHK
jgi:NAD(P)-dependent dehydrogenase (short-subunit alcohol dehydrogenase family)